MYNCSIFSAVIHEAVEFCRMRLSSMANQICSQICCQPAIRDRYYTAVLPGNSCRCFTETGIFSLDVHSTATIQNGIELMLGLLEKDAVIVCHGDDDQCGNRWGQKQSRRFGTPRASCLQILEHSSQRQSVNCQARRTTHVEGQRCCEL